MNNYEKLEGMVAATFTPLDENGDVNLSVIDNMLIGSIDSYQRGICVRAQSVNFLH